VFTNSPSAYKAWLKKKGMMGKMQMIVPPNIKKQNLRRYLRRKIIIYKCSKL
jgi:hypothetical protein